MDTRTDAAEFFEEFLREPVLLVPLVDAIIRHAHAVGASDIHLDPTPQFIAVRLRIHGTLRDVYHLPKHIHAELIARLKILAELRTDEHYLPQDGRFKIELSSSDTAAARTCDIRVSILPTYYGENAVLRILSSHENLSSLESLGFLKHHQALIHRALHLPHGLILITGPTGSGKTSTLYALLQLLRTKETSIVTIEDPIEYSMVGINQIQVHENGLTFVDGLRSVLRQDPNVIGVGEIRDKDTATLAVHAALTGHLVFSTLHTNDAATALPRLIAMGVEPYLIASTLTLVIAQRLMQRLCDSCKVSTMLEDSQAKQLRSLPADVSLPHTLYISKGCARCNGTGTNGRIGLFEILSIDARLRSVITDTMSARDVALHALTLGMQPLYQDGFAKVTLGLIGLDAVLPFIHD